MTNWRAYSIGDTPVPGPWGIAVTGISDTAVPAIESDFVRHGVLFHNPQAGTVLRVLPAGQVLVAGQGGIVLDPFATLMLHDAEGGNLGEDWSRVRINCAWQVVADSPGSWGLTVWTFTDQLGPAALSRPNLHTPTANLNIDPDIPSPIGWQFALTTISSQILPYNRQRRGVMWHNPGTSLKGIAPGNLAATIGAGSIVLQPRINFQIRHGGKVRCNAVFNAVSGDVSDPALTALEYV